MSELPDEDEGPKRPGRERKTKRDQETKSALYHLTPQELRFVQGMATHGNATEAIREAGYRGDGKRGKVRAWRLMQKPVVRAAIYELKSQAWDKAGIETAQWYRETATLAFLPPEMLEGKPRHADKLKALALLGDSLKLLEKTAPGAPQKGIINLIVQAGNPTQPVIKVQSVERIERGSESDPEPLALESRTS